MPAYRGTRPFQVIHIDTTREIEVYNGMGYVLHAYGPFSHFHLSAAMKNRDQTSLIHNLGRIIEIVERNTQKKITTFRRRQRLQQQIHRLARWKGIEFTTTPGHTPNQNKPAERAGAVIASVARSLHIHNEMPENLWPPIYQTATYIVNRTRTVLWDGKHLLRFSMAGNYVSQEYAY